MNYLPIILFATENEPQLLSKYRKLIADDMFGSSAIEIGKAPYL